jgi:glycosyltransferase involved in cell wall biosynthesis
MTISLYTEGLAFNGNTLRERALGGSETAFISVARELARMGHTVTAYCLCDAEGNYDGVEYKHISKVEELEHTECDLFICSRYFYCLFKPLRVRVRLLWLHDIMLQENAYWLEKLCPTLDAVFCLSDFHAIQVVGMLPPLAPLLRFTVNGVDLEEIAEAISPVEQKRHKIMFTSRPERGLVAALEHYEALDDKSLELVVCTYYSVWDAEVTQLEAFCKARIEDLIARGFPVTSGNFIKQELYRNIAESKAVIYPTDFPEIFCISAIEAQACGTAFLTTDDFALVQTVGYERTPVNDAVAFRERLVRVLADEDYRRDLEERGRRHAQSYTWQRVAREFVAEMEHVEERRRAPQPVPVSLVDRTTSPVMRELPRANAAARRRAADVPRDLARMDAAIRSGYRHTRDRWREHAHTPALNGNAPPKISCLTVTLNRLGLLKAAIRCYVEQTYPNRELVIVTDGSARYKLAIEDHVAALDRDDIKLVFLEGEHTLGRLRNIAVESASGEIICQWDDDDLYHPQRLAEQAACMQAGGARACFLTDHLQFFYEERRLLWIDWDRDAWLPSMWNLIPGTLMMYRDDRFRYPESGEHARMGEDTAFLASFYDEIPIARLGGKGYLYLYTYHGRNTYGADHHRALVASSVSAERIHESEKELRRAFDYYQIPMPYTLNAGEEAVVVVKG